MTITQKIHQEIEALPDDRLQEVLDFVLFVKSRVYIQTIISQSEQDVWRSRLPEIALTYEEQVSLAEAREERGQEMTITEFQAYLEHETDV